MITGFRCGLQVGEGVNPAVCLLPTVLCHSYPIQFVPNVGIVLLGKVGKTNNSKNFQLESYLSLISIVPNFSGDR